MVYAPEKPRVLNNCALALMRDGEYPAALELLDRAVIQVERRDANRRQALRVTVLTNRFLALYALRRNAEARETLRHADPSDPRVQQFTRWLDSISD